MAVNQPLPQKSLQSKPVTDPMVQAGSSESGGFTAQQKAWSSVPPPRGRTRPTNPNRVTERVEATQETFQLGEATLRIDAPDPPIQAELPSIDDETTSQDATASSHDVPWDDARTELDRQNWLALHSSDLITRLTDWSEDLARREANLAGREAEFERRARQFRLRSQQIRIELDQLDQELQDQQRTLQQQRDQLDRAARQLAMARFVS